MDQLRSYLERPKLYANVDGVGELSMGFMCLSYALFAWLEAHAPQNSAWHQTYAFLIYVAAMVSVIHYGSRAIKNRITFPRTGFIDYRPRDKYWVPMAMAAGITTLLGAGLHLAVRRHWEISVPGSLMGLVFAAAYIRLARTVRWKWAVFCVMLAATLVIAALPEDLAESVVNHKGLTSAVPAKTVGAYWLTFAAGGAVFLISGGISFWLYLRHTQAPEQEGE